VYVTCEADVLEVLECGNANRMIGSTLMNAQSSRSHALLTLTLRQQGPDGAVRVSKLNVADLAGSEKVGKKTEQASVFWCENCDRSFATPGGVRLHQMHVHCGRESSNAKRSKLEGASTARSFSGMIQASMVVHGGATVKVILLVNNKSAETIAEESRLDAESAAEARRRRSRAHVCFHTRTASLRGQPATS